MTNLVNIRMTKVGARTDVTLSVDKDELTATVDAAFSGFLKFLVFVLKEVQGE